MATVKIDTTLPVTIAPSTRGRQFFVVMGPVHLTVGLADLGNSILDRMEDGNLSHTDALTWADHLEREAFVIRSHVGAANIIAKGE